MLGAQRPCLVRELPIFLLAAGALVGAAAGGTLGYVAAGLTGAGVGVGVGAIAGLTVGATALALSRPVCLYPLPCSCYCGYYYRPVYYPGRPVYYMLTA
jgi:hypothetical protein